MSLWIRDLQFACGFCQAGETHRCPRGLRAAGSAGNGGDFPLSFLYDLAVRKNCPAIGREDRGPLRHLARSKVMEEKRSIRPRGAIPGFRGKTRKEMAESLLSDRDRHHLSQGARKHALLRDGVAAVARGRHAGFFLGGGGIGKSMPLAEELRRLDVPFVLTNAHVRGRGLADRLHACPDSIHVREDVGETVHDRPRSAAIRAPPRGPPGTGFADALGVVIAPLCSTAAKYP